MAYLLSTATKAVRVAQRCSLGNARAFSSANAGPSLGAIDLNVRSMKPSATLAINEASLALQAEGKTVAKFGLGQSPFPVPDVMVEALQAHAAEKDYLAVAGLAPFRQVLADWCNRTVGGRDHRADDMCVCVCVCVCVRAVYHTCMVASQCCRPRLQRVAVLAATRVQRRTAAAGGELGVLPAASQAAAAPCEVGAVYHGL